MEISLLPENYSGAFSDLIYTITGANPQQPLEVSVLGELSSDVLGVKRYRGQKEYTVNIANYMQRTVDVVPEYLSRCSLFDPLGRITAGKISIGTQITQERFFTAGIKKSQKLSLMSDAPLRHTIAPGEIDELSFISKANQPIFIYGFLVKGDDIHEMAFSNAAFGTDKITSLLVNMDHVEQWAANSSELRSLEAYTHLEINLEKDSKLVPVRKYELRPRRGRSVRLCWVNAYGALDYYTFPLCDGRNIRAEKSRVYTSAGYKISDSSAQKTYSIKSEYENAETMQWLAAILNSPKVWITKDRSFIPVDVLTDTIQFGGSAPQVLSLTIREICKSIFQKL